MNFWMGVIFGSRPSATIEQHHPDELSRLLINHDGYRTNVAITHDSGHHLCTVAWRTTNWIWAHHFLDLHGYLLRLHVCCRILILSTTCRSPANDCAMRTARSCCFSLSTVPVNTTALSSAFTLTLVLASAGSEFRPCSICC